MTSHSDNSTGPDLGPLDVSGSAAPYGYVTPPFPGLYWPWEDGKYLYYATSIWRFTLYWELILVCTAFFVCGMTAFFVLARSRRHVLYAASLPVAFVILGALIAVVSATVISFIVASVYAAGLLRASTWVPFLWACAQTLLLIINSYSTVTSIL